MLEKFHKYRNSECFAHRDNLINTTKLIPTHSYNTCHLAHNDLNTVPYLKTVCQRSFLFNAIQFWNKLPFEIKSLPD